MKQTPLVMGMLFLILVAGCILVLQNPNIESVSNEWGDITHGETTVLTTVCINNPNKVSIPIKEVFYKIIVDGIELGEMESKNLQDLPPQKSNISFTSIIDNGKLPDIWITHIQNGEESVVTLDGYAIFDLKVKKYELPISITTNVSTDLLYPLNSIVEKNFPNVGITLRSVSARWKKVDFNFTTMEIKLSLYNQNLQSINISKINFQIDTNGIELAKGMTTPSYLPPQSERDLLMEININNNMIDEYWVSHLRNGERTIINIKATGEIEKGGEKYEVSLIEGSTTFSTNITEIMSGKLSEFPKHVVWKALPLQEISLPIIMNITHNWGRITYGSTEIKSDVRVYNPNKFSTYTKLSGDVIVNGIKLASVESENTLPPSETTYMFVTTELDNGKLPDIWISHIQNGEKSRIEFKGHITYMCLSTPSEEYHFNFSLQKDVSTDMLSTIKSINAQNIPFGRLEQFSITVKPINAEWGSVNYSTTHITLYILVHNNNLVPIAIPKFNVAVEDLTSGQEIASGESDKIYTFGRNGSENDEQTISVDLTIPNNFIYDSWTHHIQNHEETQLQIKIGTTIKVGDVTFEINKIIIGTVQIATHILKE